MKNFTLLLAAAALSVSSAFAVTPKTAVNMTSSKANAIAKFEGNAQHQSRANAALDVEWEQWNVDYIGVSSTGSLVRATGKMPVAIDGENVYIGGWYPYLADMYVTGKINEDKIDFDNKQFIGTDTKWGDDAYLLATNAVVQGNSITGFESVGATFSLDYDAESKTISSPDEYFTLFVNTGDGDEPNDYYNLLMDPTFQYVEPQDVVELPEGVEAEDWMLTDLDGFAGLAKVAFDGTDVYLGGFDEEVVPGAWVKGTVDGKTITLANAQYMGYAEDYGVDIYFLGATIVDSEGNYEIPETMTLSYDADAKKIQAGNNDVYAVNAATDRIYYVDIFYAPTWAWVDPNVEPGKPVNPGFYAFMPYDDADGYGGMIWTITRMSDTGAMIPADDLFYCLFADDEPYILEEPDYIVDEPITEIPYMLQPEDALGDYGIYVDYPAANDRAIWFYQEITDNVGCQVVYRKGDEVLKSQVVWYDIVKDELYVTDEGPGSGIADVTINSEVSNVEYYNVAGQKVNNPRGFAIMKVTMTDGTTKAVKVNK